MFSWYATSLSEYVQIKKSMASEGNTRSAAAQAAANQKNQAQKPPATGSPWKKTASPCCRV
jgi:hypothetical protein